MRESLLGINLVSIGGRYKSKNLVMEGANLPMMQMNVERCIKIVTSKYENFDIFPY